MLLRLMPFTSVLTHNLSGNSRILPGGYATPSFETMIASCLQNQGWLVRGAVDGQEWTGQSYEGGTST